jgi:EAL domain-containing protein (putative c-di-GMP-specific phosphodiesterase class I)
LYVVEQAARSLTAWRREGIELDLSVNLSARNLLDEELPNALFQILHHHGVEPSRLTIEVTESATMRDPAKAIRVLEALRDGGAAISIDDFGTGNASIDYLARLPADEIKIDRTFVTDICDDARADAIVRSTIDLARHLGLRIVAEGIETADVLEHLTMLGCNIGQGYFISKPLPGPELAAKISGAAVKAGTP